MIDSSALTMDRAHSESFQQPPFLLEARHVSFGYAGRHDPNPVLHRVSLQLPKGQSMALMGVSGTGKSTLLHLLGLLEVPCQGDILVDGVCTTSCNEEDKTLLRRHKIGFVYQFHHLLNDLTSVENIMLPLLIAGKSRSVARATAIDLLQSVHLRDVAHHLPNQLSGGQKQRVALARALANQPSIILADEPTGNLDEQSAQDVFNLLLQLKHERGVGLLMVTHNTALAQQCDHVRYMASGSLHLHPPSV